MFFLASMDTGKACGAQTCMQAKHLHTSNKKQPKKCNALEKNKLTPGEEVAIHLLTL